MAEGPSPRYGGDITRTDVGMASNVASPYNTLTYAYSYDKLNRLTSASPTPNNIGANESYAYLDDGRIDGMTRGAGSGEYDYNTTTGRLTAVDGDLVSGRDMDDSPFSYDHNGNLVQDASKAESGQPLKIHYRADNLPYLFTYKDGGYAYKTLMAYDASGQRVSKITRKAGDWESTKSYFGSGKEVREKSGSLVEFDNMADMGRVSYNLSRPAGHREFYLTDHLGTTREIYDGDSGKVTYSTHNFPYGKTLGENRTAQEDATQKFTTKELDDGIDLTYFGARYYDQDLGVWTSPDKARQFHSAYTYASNNPVNHTDPDGNFDPEGTASAGLQIATGVSLTTLGASFTGSTAGIGSLFGGGTLMLAGGAETYMGAMNFLTSLVSPANPPAGTYLPSLVDMTIERAFMPSAKPMFEYAGLATDLTDAAKGGGLGMFSVGAWVTQQAFKSTAVPEIGNSARGVSPTDALQTTSPLRQK